MENNKSTTPKSARIAAIIALVFIAIALIGSVILALFYTGANKSRVMMLFFGVTMVLPILAWLYTWLIGTLMRKHTVASFDILGDPKGEIEKINKEMADKNSPDSDK